MSNDQPMSRREREALADIKSWPAYGHYIWKQASMRKLEARGLVKPIGQYGGQEEWALTARGRAYD